LGGTGEWLFGKQGTTKRRSWRKLHIGIDGDSGEIVSFDLTNKDVDDAWHVETLLDQLADAPASCNKRSKVEVAISCYKRVIGDTLKSRRDARRATEVAITVKSLNRMNELGRAHFVRVA
jgi:hypothetical protein